MTIQISDTTGSVKRVDDSQERKETPVFSGFFEYFPDAIKAVARHSFKSNEKHNPNEPLHWAKDKSDDHLDCLGRHLLEGELVAVAWRAMAALQIEIEDGDK